MLSIRQLLASLIPTRTRIVRVEKYEPPAISHTLSADRLHAILRSAESGDMRDFFALSRDILTGHGHTLAEISKRKLAAIGDQQIITPRDPDSPEDQAVAAALEQTLDDLPGWMDALVHLLDSTVLPLALVEKVYRPSARPGWRYELASLRAVPYHLLDYTTGRLRIRDTGPDGAPLGTYHEPEPIRYILHRGHLLSSVPDTWGGPMRALLFWWLFSAMGRDWWGRFLERYGSPFTVGKYDQADDGSRVQLETALSAATRLFGLVVSNDTSVELHQANTTGGGDAFEKFHAVANREISKILVGQTLSAEGQNLGLGGGQATVQENVRADIETFDQARLAHTLRTQLFLPLCRLNDWRGAAPEIGWGAPSDEADSAALAGILSSLSQAGIELTDEGIAQVSERVGVALQRAATPPAGPAAAFSALAAGVPPSLRRRSADASQACDAIAAAGDRPLAAAFRGAFAPVRRLILESTSQADLEARLRAYYADYPPARLAALVEEALAANAANAAANFREVPAS